GNYENLNTDDTATVTVSDTVDTTTVTLGDVSVDEGGNATITATVDNAPQTDLTLNLSNGETVTIAAGTTTGSATFAVQGDDPYVDGGSFTVGIDSATGGNYENLNTDDTATVTVSDTVDTTTVTLGDVSVDEGGNATITATVDNAPQTDLTLNLSNGETVTIAAGTTTGSATFAVQGDDPYVDGGSFTVGIDSTTGGNYENLNTDDTATVTVSDTTDTTTVTLGDVSVDEGGNATITATVDNAPQTDLTLNLSNGETVTIAAGTTTGSATFAVQGDDPYVDGGSFTVGIDSATGGNYENLNTDDTATVTVSDTVDTTTVTLGDVSVDEGGNATITATVDNAPQTDLTLNLSNG
ncbi:immunoglobulin-like domain-containing protein, partial [Desulfovibrio sp. Fe33]|uniref:immunoglobulin-like domain-containing protein n=1 Tax=Desulfovibrio sp. Fe33 TaxID=3020842 RepID=UPI00234E0F53